MTGIYGPGGAQSETNIRVKRLTIGTLFKLVALGTLIPIAAFCIVCGFLALVGMQTVHFNGEAVTGLNGLVAGILIGLGLWLFIAIPCWLSMFVGLWLYSLVRPIRIKFVPMSPAGGASDPG